MNSKKFGQENYVQINTAEFSNRQIYYGQLIRLNLFKHIIVKDIKMESKFMKTRKYFSKLLFMFMIAIFFSANNEVLAQRRPVKKVHKKIVINTPPRGAKKIIYKNVNYHFVDGVFYKHRDKKYIVVKPPIGLTVKVLPSHAKILHIAGIKYHYYYGNYYRYLPELQVYEVVDNPNVNTTIYDEILLSDGSKMEGFYLGGTISTIQFEVDDEILEIPVADIIRISFAPPTEE